MLHIILTILKVIGIIAALILTLILLAGLAVLFVPVRYKIAGKKRGCDLESGVRISWMFRMVSAEIQQQKKKVQFTVKIFGKTLEQWKKIVKRRKKEKEESEKVHDMFQEETWTEPTNVWSDSVKETEAFSPPEKKCEEQRKTEEEKVAEDEKHCVTEQRTEEHLKEREKISSESDKEYTEISKRHLRWKRFFDFPGILWKRMQIVQKRIKKLWKNLKKRLRGVKKSLIKVKEIIDYYYTLFQKEQTKQAIQFCKMQLVWIVKKIAPKKIKGDIRFGAGDPAVTGEIMGLVSVFLPVYSYELELNPDFEEKILEGEIEATGSVRGWYFLVLAWRFFRNKDIKYVMKRIKR